MIFLQFFTKGFLQKKLGGGFSIIEALLGIFLFVIAFYALYGVLQFSFALISQNKARLGAMALVEEQIEYARSLSFSNVGTAFGNPGGVLPQTETISLNGISYTRRNVVAWMDDPKDGTATIPNTMPGSCSSTSLGTDSVPTDYKQIKVEVSWNFRGFVRAFSSISNITPKGCEINLPGGVFKFTVLNEQNQPVPGASIFMFRSPTSTTRITNSIGEWYEYGVFPGTGWEITVTKPGYSTARTYAPDAILVNPNPGHLTSIDDTVNPMSFNIDKVSGANVYMYSPPAPNTWSDTFADLTKISDMASTTVTAQNITLTDTLGVYDLSGSATSVWIEPANLLQWKQFSWNDTTLPGVSSLTYRVYYDAGSVPTLVSDSDLPGNSAGFTVSPIDLSILDTTPWGQSNYPKLRVGVFASTTDTVVTPLLHDWTIKYDIHVPLLNFTFNMLGAKTIGMDSVPLPVYKFNQNLTTNTSAVWATTSIEYDTYTISKAGYDIAESCPAQPMYIPPDTAFNAYIDMAPQVQHSILVQVKNLLGADVPGAHVRLYRASAPALDEMKVAGLRCGQAFWSGLAEGLGADQYSVEASAPPYTSTSTPISVDVSGYSTFTATVN